MVLSREEIGEIAARTADEVMERIREPEYDSLMLHSLPSLNGSPGVVVDEARAKAMPCKCVEYKTGKALCWSPGIIGALTDEQEEQYCSTVEVLERPGIVSRMAKWQEAVDACKVEIASIPEEKGKERVVAWLSCISRELNARGINPGFEGDPEIQVGEEVYQAIKRRQRPEETISQTMARLIKTLPELRVEENLLTSTEHEVLRLAAEGLSNKEIAERLGISPGTVLVHLMDIRRRIGVRTTEEAVAAFGKPTERERVPFPALREVTEEERARREEEREKEREEEWGRISAKTVGYANRAASLLTLVDEIESHPSMETVRRLENELVDLVRDVGRARELARGREADMLGSLHGRLAVTVGDIAPVRAALTAMEQETLPLRIEAAKRAFSSAIRVLRENLVGWTKESIHQLTYIE